LGLTWHLGNSIQFLAFHMVKLKTTDIGFAAIDTGMIG